MGSNLSILNDTPHTWLVKCSPTPIPDPFQLTDALLTTLLPLSASPSAAAIAAAKTLRNTLKSQEYYQITPGLDERWHEVSRTKPQHAHCVRLFPEGGQVVREEVWMTEIKSGGAPSAMSTHRIKWWCENGELKVTRFPAVGGGAGRE